MTRSAFAALLRVAAVQLPRLSPEDRAALYCAMCGRKIY